MPNSFNSSKVQLEPSTDLFIWVVILSFNSSKVQLEQSDQSQTIDYVHGFNSSKVQLELDEEKAPERFCIQFQFQ